MVLLERSFFLGGGGYTSGAQYVYSLKQGRKSAYHVTFRRVQVLASRTV